MVFIYGRKHRNYRRILTKKVPFPKTMDPQVEFLFFSCFIDQYRSFLTLFQDSRFITFVFYQSVILVNITECIDRRKRGFFD